MTGVTTEEWDATFKEDDEMTETIWTIENTEGFTQADLDMINDVRDTLLEGFTGEAYSVDDAINNTWYAGISREQLARRAMATLMG